MRRGSRVKVHEGSNAVTIEIQGDLVASTERDMDAAFQEACEYNPSNIVLKFGGKTHINSTGIAILINLLIDSRKKGCRIFVAGLSRHYRKIFEMSGLTKYTTIIESEDEITDEEDAE